MKITDGDWRLFSFDRETGKLVWKCEGEDGRMHFRIDMPVEDILAQNKFERNHTSHAKKDEWRKIASIPLNVFHGELHEAHSQGDNHFVSKWLNDSDHRAFRCTEGRV